MRTVRRIKLTKSRFAKVDAEDFERVNAFKWYASNESRGTKWYAVRRETVNGKKVKVRMHRFILGIARDNPMVVDHLNHDSLDNRKSNLEVVTQTENMHRSPGWRGGRSFQERKQKSNENKNTDLNCPYSDCSYCEG